MLYYEELFTRSSCLNCRYEISGLGVECSECQPQGAPFRLCAECFASGTEIGSHKKEHPYRYFDSGSLALFPGSRQDISSSKENNSSSTTNAPTTSNRWSAREEIRLLDAIEQYGFGNWQDISKHIESRGAIEAKEEFVHRHVDGNVGKVSWAESNNSSAENKWSSEFKGSVGIFPQPIDHTSPGDEGPLSPSLTQRLPPLDISSDEMLQLGYMPFRDDYEKEYDNEAEKLVSQLNFTPEDDELEIGLKLALVDLYSARLRERARRKRVIRDYQLVCKFFKKDRAKKAAGIGALNSDADGTEPGGGNKETVKKFQISEKQLQEKFRPFSQFYNSREFDNLARNLVKEKDLRLRLSELFKYRNVGITRGEECIEFERSRGPSGQGNGLRKRPAASAGLGTVEEEDDERSQEGVDDDSESGSDSTTSTTTNSKPDPVGVGKRRKRRRKRLCHPKSHSAVVLQRRLQLKKLGIKRIGSCFITPNATGRGNSASTGSTTTKGRLIPTKRATKGHGRPIYC